MPSYSDPKESVDRIARALAALKSARARPRKLGRKAPPNKYGGGSASSPAHREALLIAFRAKVSRPKSCASDQALQPPKVPGKRR